MYSKLDRLNNLLKELGFISVSGNIWKHKTQLGFFQFDEEDDIVKKLIEFGENMKAAEIRGCLNIPK